MTTPIPHGTAGLPAVPPRTTTGYRAVILHEAPHRTPADHEHCAADPALLAELGAEPGQQARITTCGVTALFTLVESPMRDHLDEVFLTPTGLSRLGTSDHVEAFIDLRVVRDEVDENEVRDRSEFIEHLVDLTAHRILIAVAPHGGAMERHTDHQAEYMTRILGLDRASTWMCKGWHRGGGAFAKWHITSRDISERSFPLLNTIMPRRFRHAVAFHGYHGDEVLIGGGADLAVKTKLQTTITEALSGSGISVRVVPPGQQYDGYDPANLVNRITSGNSGIQIEQSRQVRRRHWTAVAEAVAHVYRELAMPH